MKKLLAIGLFLGFALTLQPSWADEAGHEGAVVKQEEKAASNIGMKAIAAAIAVGLSALASGIAQGRIGAAGAGALADKPEVVGSIIILEAIPETMIILGFVVSVLIIFVL